MYTPSGPPPRGGPSGSLCAAQHLIIDSRPRVQPQSETRKMILCMSTTQALTGPAKMRTVPPRGAVAQSHGSISRSRFFSWHASATVRANSATVFSADDRRGLGGSDVGEQQKWGTTFTRRRDMSGSSGPQTAQGQTLRIRHTAKFCPLADHPCMGGRRHNPPPSGRREGSPTLPPTVCGACPARRRKALRERDAGREGDASRSPAELYPQSMGITGTQSEKKQHEKARV